MRAYNFIAVDIWSVQVMTIMLVIEQLYLIGRIVIMCVKQAGF